ncbi:hypothetical protein DIPPA_24126 [Diplonema papillatum]|nr:hypothetical protein DIPPA_24126 [Diplonema papillatum]
MATSDYLARGNDGYDVFAKQNRVIDCEQGIILPVLLRNFLFLQRWGEALIQNQSIVRRIFRNRSPMTAKLLTKGSICPLLEGRIEMLGTFERPVSQDTSQAQRASPGSSPRSPKSIRKALGGGPSTLRLNGTSHAHFGPATAIT